MAESRRFDELCTAKFALCVLLVCAKPRRTAKVHTRSGEPALSTRRIDANAHIARKPARFLVPILIANLMDLLSRTGDSP